MEIKASDVKKLRDMTGFGMMDAKAALQEAKGNLDKAVQLLQKRGAELAEKKSDRSAGQGVIASYIHPGDRIGVLVELNCETDFVARNKDFQKLAYNLAVHVAGMQPLYVSPEAVPSDVVKKETELYKAQAKGKPKAAADSLVAGKLNSFYESVCLLNQPYVLDPDKKVADLITEAVGSWKENINVSRFVRFEVGDRE